jgi:hypothetical protein
VSSEDDDQTERRERRTRVDLTWRAQDERRNPARGRRASDVEFWNSLPASVRESLAARAAAEDAPPTTPAAAPELIELDARISALQTQIEQAWAKTAGTGDGEFEADTSSLADIVTLAGELEALLAQRRAAG